jgi:hypothetical protein
MHPSYACIQPTSRPKLYEFKEVNSASTAQAGLALRYGARLITVVLAHASQVLQRVLLMTQQQAVRGGFKSRPVQLTTARSRSADLGFAM